MRKKLLSLLTVLCLVLGMLPTTAFAAAAEAYEKNEVARVITTDTEIAEDIDGLVLVDAPCKVTVKDAKLSVGIVVSPDAAGAEVILTGTTEAAEVVVLSASSVKVEETATATSVTVDAAEATVEVAGTAAEVIVTENAEKTAVTVAETAKVETVSVAAPAAAVEVVGEVKTVAVAETAAAATVTVAETATVSALEVAAPDVKADVAGTVESVTVAETATGAELVVAETATITEVTDATGELTVSGDGADKVTVNDTTASEEEEEEEAVNVDVPFVTPTLPAAPKIQWAPLHNHSGDSDEDPGADQTEDLTTSHGISVSATAELDNGGVRADVTLSATDLQMHTNGADRDGYWIGFGIPVEANNDTSYKLYVMKKNAEDTSLNNTWTCLGAVDTFYNVGDDWFASLYFGTYLDSSEMPEEVTEDTESVKADEGTEYVVVVTTTDKVAEGAENITLETPDDLDDISGEGDDAPKEGEEIIYVLDVTIDATLVPEGSDT